MTVSFLLAGSLGFPMTTSELSQSGLAPNVFQLSSKYSGTWQASVARRFPCYQRGFLARPIGGWHHCQDTWPQPLPPTRQADPTGVLSFRRLERWAEASVNLPKPAVVMPSGSSSFSVWRPGKEHGAA